MTTGLQRLHRFLADRPLVGFTIVIAAGAAAACSLPLPRHWLLAAALATGLLALATRHRGPLSSCILISFSFLASWSFAIHHPALTGGDCGLPEGPVTVTGTVRGDPQIRPLRKGHVWLWTFEIRGWAAQGYDDTTDNRPLAVTWIAPRETRAPHFGETWQLVGRLSRQNEATRPQVTASPRQSRRLASGQGSWLAAHCYAGRHAAETCLSQGLENQPEAAAILKALLLGYRGRLSERSREIFTTTGTLHIFAISGLHVGIVALLISYVLRLLRVSRLRWVLFLAPLLIAYTLATGARPSAIRACIMAITLFLAPLLGRRADPPCAIALAALLLLAWNPRHIQDMGFIYTFAVVAGLILMTPRIEAWFRRLCCTDRPELVRQPASMHLEWTERLHERLSACWRSLLKALCGLAALSCAAWLVSTPLTAYWFGRVSPIALLANILIVPVAFGIVLVGCLSVLFGACWPLLSIGFNAVNLLMIGLAIHVLELCAATPLASIEIAPPPLWGIILWYSGMGMGLLALPPPERPASKQDRQER